MFFRPSFCANCGEKIERSDWGLFTSRRFCPVCEIEFKGIDLLPRVIVTAGALAGILGLGGYLKSGSADTRVARLASQPVERTVSAAQLTQPPASVVVPTPSQQPSSASGLASAPKTLAAAPPQTEVARNQPQDVVYMCGAMTKKGTPCSRRVHGPVRCYQHTGMPAMVPQEKLRIN